MNIWYISRDGVTSVCSFLYAYSRCEFSHSIFYSVSLNFF